METEKKYKEALEKAKAYDEALELMKDCIPDENGLVHVRPEEIFPELKESEDERIRKALLELVRQSSEILDKQNQNNMIAWLEKQGETDKESYEIAEKEKADFVGDGFIECHADFLDFKEGNTYWLEYIGDDRYNVRSDNLLGKTYHITPCQLYTIFKKLTWLEKQKEPELSEDLGEYVTELNKQFPEVSFAKLSRIAVRVKNWLERQGEQKSSIRERYDRIKDSEWFKCGR